MTLENLVDTGLILDHGCYNEPEINMATPEKRLELDQKIKDSIKRVKSIRSAQIEYVKFGMKNAQDFYYRLSLLCGGTIGLSITFVGYLASNPNRVSFIGILFASWFCLLVSMIGSLYRNHFHGSFLHFQMQKRFLESKVEQEEIALEGLEKAPETVFNSYDGIENLINAAKQRLGVYKKSAKYNASKEKFYDLLWVNSMRLAHVGFILGMILIMLFTGLNLFKI